MTVLAIFTEELLCCLEKGRFCVVLTEEELLGLWLRAAVYLLNPWQPSTIKKQTLKRLMTERVLVFDFLSKLKAATSLGNVNSNKQMISYL